MDLFLAYFFVLLLEILIIFFVTVIFLDGGPKQRHWPPDHVSTLSRTRSTEAITANGNGTIPNGRLQHNGVIRGPGGLHEDIEFPSAAKTLTRRKPVTWMRPHVSYIIFTEKMFIYIFLIDYHPLVK